MTPEQLLARIDELENKVKLLEADSTIPYNVEQAFRKRLALSTFTPLTVSSGKAAASENKTVDTGAGTGSETVLDNPDGFLQVTIANTVYYIPYFS